MEKRKINRFCEVAALVLALFALLTLIGTGLTERVHLGTWGGKTEDVAFLPISPVQGAALLLGGMLAALSAIATFTSCIVRFRFSPGNRRNRISIGRQMPS